MATPEAPSEEARQKAKEDAIKMALGLWRPAALSRDGLDMFLIRVDGPKEHLVTGSSYDTLWQEAKEAMEIYCHEDHYHTTAREREYETKSRLLALSLPKPAYLERNWLYQDRHVSLTSRGAWDTLVVVESVETLWEEVYEALQSRYSEDWDKWRRENFPEQYVDPPILPPPTRTSS